MFSAKINPTMIQAVKSFPKLMIHEEAIHNGFGDSTRYGIALFENVNRAMWLTGAFAGQIVSEMYAEKFVDFNGSVELSNA